jgi:5-methylthioadenosine/S-adenosylhomocysteine deaminase
MVRRLIKHIDWVITLDGDRRMIADGAIAIAGDRIELIGKSDEVEKSFQADEAIDGRTLIAVPGLIDTNVATVQQLGRGAADYCDIPKFMLERIFPYEAALSSEDAAIATRACQLEMIRSGTTCFVDSGSRYPEVVAGVAHETGLRALVPRAAYDEFDTIMGAFPKPFARETTEQAVVRAEDAILAVEKLAAARVRPAVALPWLAAASDRLCRELSALARRKGVRLVAAAARSRDDAVASRRQHGSTEIKRLRDASALDASTIVTHAGWTSPRDLVDLRDGGAHVACCPSMSHRLGTGSLEFGRYPELLEFGANVTLGSGSAMASNYIDVARQLYLFAGGAKTYRLDATSLPPETALEMATIRGAAAIGLAREIGSLEAGKKADITMFRMLAADWAPVINPVANLVFSSRGGAHTVLVDGNILIADGRLQSIDEGRTLGGAQRCAEAIMARSGLDRFCAPQWKIH